MPSDVVKQLKDQAHRYENAARKLREAAEILESDVNGIAAHSDVPPAAGKKSRIEQIEDYLRQNGSQARKDVIRGLPKIPKGTVSALLNANNFDRTDDGLWKPRED